MYACVTIQTIAQKKPTELMKLFVRFIYENSTTLLDIT